MKKILRTTALLICVAMLVTLFAGCGDKKNNNSGFGENVTEAESEVTYINVLDSVTFTWGGSSEEFTVGKNLTTDGYVTITGLSDRYATMTVAYGENGEITGTETTDKDDGSVGTDAWTYDEEMAPATYTYRPNSYRSDRDSTYDVTKDDTGRIVTIVENAKLTDSEDGSVSYRTDMYEFSYDENGRVAAVKYYSDGEYDHTTNLTYDENGNLLVYSNVGDSGEYLRANFNYKPTDASTVTVTQTDAFTYYFNIESIIPLFI